MSDAGLELSRAIFDAQDSGLILLDREQRVLVWNAWFGAMCGIDPADAVGETFRTLFPDSPLSRLESAVSATFTSGVSSLLTHSLHPQLFPLKTRAGRTLVHDVMVNLVGRKPATVCLIQVVDVTVAAERERVLRERQNARYDAVVNSAPDVILTLDAQGVIQLANPSALAQFGYHAGELVGQPDSALFAAPQKWNDIREAVLEGRPIDQPVEVMARRKDGSDTRLEVSLSRWRSDSRPFITAILRDVNMRHAAEEAQRASAKALAELNLTLEQRVEERTAQLMQAEEALRQSAKMEAVGQLTGGIAHDFNNLLQGITGALDRIKKRISEGRIGDVDRFLDGAMQSANRAAALTHRLLAFSRRQPVDPRPVDANTLIATVEELLRRSLGETIDLKVVEQEGLWLVRCDGNQLENALLNLAINARDAMPDGGTLTIETANVRFDNRQAVARELRAGEYVTIRVTDTGVGMPADVKARAFDPFYTTKPFGQGTGLGLSMIYGFVRQSDGSIRIESEVGKGTAIEIALPRHVGEPDQPASAEPSSEDHRAGHDEVVLVVEDEGVVRLLITDILGDLGYRALEAADGISALRILQSSQRIDLLVTDIGLPGLNGRQLADAARERRPTLKVLFMTGYAETAAGKNFLEAGMEIITKPFTTDALALRIREMIESKPRQ
ncbi:MAG TPA: PAS domain S-box protein [Rhizomicrobium sp.]|nr:PAS domain S-box protein [Rhizomicrobium sp.]